MSDNASIPELTPAAFDLDAWIDGTCGLTKRAKIYQRGDLLTRIEKLQEEHGRAQKIPAEQRGVGDRTPDAILEEWEQAAEELAASTLVVYVQDRTASRRRGLRAALKKKGLNEEDPDDDETMTLHEIADSIVQYETPDGTIVDLPDGFPPNKLRDLKDRLGDTGIYHVVDAYRQVTMEAPTVAAPLSRTSSSARGGVT